ncbi:MAG: amidase domain-containing protein [Clostridia bacterium]|jgi:hypothetical protein
MRIQRLIKPYNREKALQYANQWALKRNPSYYDFSEIGGDCTNYISQCLYAGSLVMDYTQDTGWYYVNLNRRAPAWTGVPFLYRYLTRNYISPGPFGKEVDVSEIEIGDIIQLAFYKDRDFGHSLFVVQHGNPPTIDNILINTHTTDRYYYPLREYYWDRIRFIRIVGVYS